MPSDIDKLLEDFGSPVLNDSFGVSVVLRRKGESSAAFTATWQDQNYETYDADGQLMTTVQSRDFDFAVTSPLINGATVVPRAGDRLVVEGSETFEIVPIGTKPAVEKLPGDYRYLVHTKKVA